MPSHLILFDPPGIIVTERHTLSASIRYEVVVGENPRDNIIYISTPVHGKGSQI